MYSTIAATRTLSPPQSHLFHSHKPISFPNFTLHKPSRPSIRVSLSSNPNPNSSPQTPNPILKTLKTTAGTLIFTATTALLLARFNQFPAKAESPAPPPSLDSVSISESEKTPLSRLLESNSVAIDALKSLLEQKLETGEDEEALSTVKQLVSAQPENSQWKFMMARILNELGRTEEARTVFEEILASNPLSFEALFENALLMDRNGEGDAVIGRLEEALHVAEDENKEKEARDVRLIMAQIQFLQKNVDDALKSYDELTDKDPSDFRPYFCRGMIYSLLDRNVEAREQFAKYRELSPKKFDVEGFLQTPLSKTKLFGTDN